MYKLEECAERIADDRVKLEELRGKHVVFLMGLTGAGKSTISYALIKGIAKLIFNDDCRYDVAEKDIIVYKDRQMFTIGHAATSHTKTPGFYPIQCNGREIYLVDCPGFADNNRVVEYPNRTVVQMIMSMASSIRIALIISNHELEDAKGVLTLELLTTVSRLFDKF